MEVGMLCQVHIQRLLFLIGAIASVAVLVQLLELPYETYTSYLPHNNGTTLMTVSKNTSLNISTLTETNIVHGVANDTNSFKLPEKDDYKSGAAGENKDYEFDGEMNNDRYSRSNITFEMGLTKLGNVTSKDNSSIPVKVIFVSTNKEIQQAVTATSSNITTVVGTSIMKKRGKKPTTISQMNLLLHQASGSANLMRPKWSSARDRELQQARLQIENAPIPRDTPGLDASVFRNISMFKRSYELMERMLKVYIYSEGEKPIFHQPMLRGIYASEGWFMKLMEGNKKFVVKDPKKAHLFYLPFSSLKLRIALHEPNFATQNDLEKHLQDYVDIIATRYRFWNRSNGADHFLVACHDWAPKFTRKSLRNCIKTLCNSNAARDFKIEEDISLPVTNIRTSRNPMKDLGGNPPSDRPILAFFAGSMHGYLRPVLLKYWNNKVPDMKILGPMPRDIEGKTKYQKLMKSSKYCICAKGYEVHTPRIVESIYHECVPVILSDNYVPPLFGVLDWETFSVFVLEEDVPNLRNILLSIPEEKYLAMQRKVKMVQHHFVWHKEPVKYDLFHMILHSIWYKRVFQLKHG